MKHNVISWIMKFLLILIICIYPVIMTTCSNPAGQQPGVSDITGNNSPAPARGSLLVETFNTSRYSYQDVIGYAMSIVDAAGTPVFNKTFFRPGEKLELNVGTYNLTGYLAVEKNFYVLYAAPHQGSEVSQYITLLYEDIYPNPDDIKTLFLPIPFTITADQITKIQVIPVDTQGYTPQDFGYSSFIVPKPTPSPLPPATPLPPPARLPLTDITGTLLDARTKLPLDSSAGEVTITFHGPDKNKLITIGDRPLSSLTTSNGFFAFSVNPDFLPTSEQPLDFTVVAQAEDFISTSKRCLIYESGLNRLELVMVRKDSPPQGVGYVEVEAGTIDPVSHAVAETVQVTSGGNANVQSSTTVTLEEGTTLLDEKGNPLTGDLTFKVGHFSPETEESLDSFPGGFEVSADTLEGTTEDIVFVTAGFSDIEIEDEQGNLVKNFTGKPLHVKSELAPGTINPISEEPVQPGDTIPVWSYDKNTGKWSEEGDGLIQEENGKLFIEYAASHLTSWNFDWKINPTKHTFYFSGVRKGTPIRAVINGSGIKRNATFTYDGSKLELLRVPRNLPVNVKFFIYNNNIWDKTIRFNGGTTTVPVTPPETVNINFNVILKEEGNIPFTESINMQTRFYKYPINNSNSYIEGQFKYKEGGPSGVFSVPAFPIGKNTLNQTLTYFVYYTYQLWGNSYENILLFDLIMTSFDRGTISLYNPMYPESTQRLLQHTFSVVDGKEGKEVNGTVTIMIDRYSIRSLPGFPRFLFSDSD